ncbi:hypothetical protein PACTADRAFT_71320 [Pachysolen tannophilus NRRL Y-2460]|uniref:Enoyl reductase (ER) domain-containing protein n=1 Tax=Pachysolen tannophilus NRRL Y-2460 TaxID=669874 RepID=A0A1E4TP79_PACTA|nr:hypothetical protein PACTADRAFT_71320 [Pachysolen tannophilus NRRL Y-2460]
MASVDYPKEFKGFAVQTPSEWNKPKLTSYAPKTMGDHDVDIEIECCGVCASDLFTARAGWATNWDKKGSPQVVGHEIVGKVVAIGSKVTSVKLGERVGQGAQASSCLSCSRCNKDNEQYCPGMVGTYDSYYPDGYLSQGGYASHVRANEHFIFPIPQGIKSSEAAPLMCGGLTVFSPLKRNGCKPGAKVGIIGIGGLGHMAIMIAKALMTDDNNKFDGEIYAFSRTFSKKQHALEMGATHFIATAEKNWHVPLFDKFDVIINCASSVQSLDINAFLSTLGVEKKFVTVGLPDEHEKYDVSPKSFFKNGSYLSSACLGSREEALELLQLAVKHNIKPWVEEIPLSEAGCHSAMSRCWDGDCRYRFTLTKFNEFFNTGKN